MAIAGRRPSTNFPNSSSASLSTVRISSGLWECWLRLISWLVCTWCGPCQASGAGTIGPWRGNFSILALVWGGICFMGCGSVCGIIAYHTSHARCSSLGRSCSGVSRGLPVLGIGWGCLVQGCGVKLRGCVVRGSQSQFQHLLFGEGLHSSLAKACQLESMAIATYWATLTSWTQSNDCDASLIVTAPGWSIPSSTGLA